MMTVLDEDWQAVCDDLEALLLEESELLSALRERGATPLEMDEALEPYQPRRARLASERRSVRAARVDAQWLRSVIWTGLEQPGTRAAAARVQAGVTLREAAAAVGLEPHTYGKVERNLIRLSDEGWRSLERALAIAEGDLTRRFV